METREEKRGDVKIVSLRGRLDANTSPAVEERLMRLLDQGERQLVLDFSDLTYISSVGLRVLVLAAKVLQKTRGKLALVAPGRHIYEIFQIAGFTTLFPIFPTCDEAVSHLRSGVPYGDETWTPPDNSVPDPTAQS
jgi:anti-sigma B factor antagonist